PSHLAAKVVRVGGLESMTRMFPMISSKTTVSPDYVLTGTNYMLARDSQVSYGEKAAYFDTGKKGIPGAELAIASSFDIDAASINNILTREGGAGAGYNLLTPATSGAHTISSTCVPGAGSDPTPGCLNDLSGVDNVETALDVSMASGIANDSH